MSFDICFNSQCKKVDLLIIAGEHSGDQHAAQLISKLKKSCPDLNICAFGGQCLSDAGARLLLNITRFSVVGLVEVLGKYFFFKNLVKKIVAWIYKRQPRVVCFVDYPGMNLKIAEILFKKKLSNKAGGPIKLLYYISPQIWAWKEKRKFKIEKYIDSLATIFPFEKEYYRGTNLDVHFVGHPFANTDTSRFVKFGQNGPILLLPGSRVSVIKNNFHQMLCCFSKFLEKEPSKMATVLYSNENTLPIMRKILNKKFKHLTEKVDFISDKKSIEACATLMTSGTMSLKCCLSGIPGAIIYKSNYFTFLVGKYILKIKRLGIANILLSRNAWPEFIQNGINFKTIANYLIKCLKNPDIQTESANYASELHRVISSKPDIKPQDWLLSALG